ncbi:MAG: hypothetical protein L0H79_17855 [Intrasporangium sp.]|uniref:type II secretion system F family protein n=1 Tax=Intrasporangium sp. TaxID=1925024 RepID=UPI0026493B11|nr:hypothetical protein [Intrasporangium sp.]MDN5797596.1 hypothetical protein [Intrasporangium sp.]
MSWVAVDVNAVVAAVLVGVVVVVWPARRARVDVLLPSAGRDDATLLVHGGFAALWHEDPVQLWRRRRRAGGHASFERAVLMLLDGTAAALHAGLTPARALELGGATLPTEAPALVTGLVRQAVTAAADGHPVAPIWRAAAERTGSAAVHAVAAAWGLSETTGCPLADAVDRSAAQLRGALVAQRRVRAAVAGPQATVTVLTALPLTGPVFGLACGVPPSALYGNPVGAACLGTGLVLIWFGRQWCRHLVRRAEHPT